MKEDKKFDIKLSQDIGLGLLLLGICMILSSCLLYGISNIMNKSDQKELYFRGEAK